MTKTPNNSLIDNGRRGTKGAETDEIAERLLPKIFDDVMIKDFRSCSGAFDTKIIIKFINEFIMNALQAENKPLSVIELIT